MLLPKAMTAPAFKTERITAFRGLDARGGAPEGSFVSASGVSAREYPYLCAERALSPLGEDTGVSDFFTARGHSVTARGGGVFVDGEYVCAAEGTTLSRAVVGDRLFILPGNRLIDLENKTSEKLDERFETGSDAFSEQNGNILFSFTLTRKDVKTAYVDAGHDASKQLFAWSYNDVGTLSDLQARFDARTGTWDLPPRSHGMEKPLNYDGLSVGALIIPKNDGGIDAQNVLSPSQPLLNDTGDVAVITEKSRKEGVYYVVYRMIPRGLFSMPSYSAGDTLEISGTAGRVFDGAARLLSVERHEAEREISVSFPSGGLTAPEYYAVSEEELSGGERSVSITGDDYRRRFISLDRAVPAGSTFFKCAGKNSVFVIRAGETEREEYPFISADNLFDADVVLDDPYPASQTGVFVRRAFPALDFVCEKDGRLCGVSNADKKIYLSVPGAPGRMYDAQGGAYAVSVGSDGDFTGTASFGGALCCFKEHEIIKLLGASPLDYYLASYPAEGVQKGSSRSLVSYGGLLYYKGENGFYSYGGAYPKRLSDPLGNLADTVTAAGADGGRYYASTGSALYTLELKTGIWTRGEGGFSAIERGENALCFCRDGALLRFDETAAPGEWYAVFAPFYGKTCGKKSLSTVALRIELSKGAYADALLSEDGAAFRRVLTLPGGKERCVTAKVKTGLCDSFTLKLSGKGAFRLKCVERVYRDI